MREGASALRRFHFTCPSFITMFYSLPSLVLVSIYYEYGIDLRYMYLVMLIFYFGFSMEINN